MTPCQLCQAPTEPVICLTCLHHIEDTLRTVPALIRHLREEAGGQVKKTASGWSSGGTTVDGVRFAPLEAIDALETSITRLARHIEVITRSALTLLKEAHKLCWVRENQEAISALHFDFMLAVRTATRLIDTPPELKLFGWCPSCHERVWAPADRTYQDCECGQGIDLLALIEERGEMIHDRLDGTYMPPAAVAEALRMCGYEVKQVSHISTWGARGKVDFREVDGKLLYLFDDALHQAELKELRRQKRTSKVLDLAA